MSDTDFSAARSALVGALNVAGPILTALQQAETVFGVLANAEKHKRMLESEVSDYKVELEKTKTAVSKQQEKLKAVTAEIGIAEKDADTRIEAALQAEKAQLAAAKLSVAQDISALNTARAKAQAEADAAIVAAQAAMATITSDLAAKEAALQSDITALEKKLAALRANAAKFAAALTAE